MSYVRRDWHEFCKQCGICAGILRIFVILMQKSFFAADRIRLISPGGICHNRATVWRGKRGKHDG